MQEERAILAGGCFWGMQDLLRRVPGVIRTTVGYTGGTLPNPTYQNMKDPDNTHAEAIEIFFDPVRLTYQRLLQCFFQMHDPTTPNRQGNDVGVSYRSAIFYVDEAQKETAHAVINAMTQSGKWPGPIVTEIVPARVFYAAEPSHQDYLERIPHGYTCHFIRPDWWVEIMS